jgi:disulfide oxidoreductase YuzD
MEALENCHEYGDIIVQDKQGTNFKIHSIQQDDKFNTILVIESEYVSEENWEE